ncbi:MAG: 6-bladed beta-propeller [Candidatus Latescibacteria bacterium]|nr:6-bladed beta-propeller [Candidatus Latescibacterota bacterium]
MRLTLLALSGAVLIALTACGRKQHEEWGGEIVLEDGVLHIYNPSMPLWGIDVKPLVETEVLGGPGAVEEAFLAEPIALVCGRDGTRYVLEGKDARILRFDAVGAFLGSFGRQGAGPGEFASPTDLTILPDNDLLVADSGNRRLSRFTQDGEFLDSVTLQRDLGQIVASRTGDIYLHAQPRTMAVSIRMGALESEEELTLIDILDARGRRTGGFGSLEEYEGLMLGSWMNRVQPALTTGDSLVLNYLGKDRIEVYTPDGVLARVAHRSLPFEPVEPMEQSRQTVNDDGTISVSILFEFDILSTGFAVHPDGRWWAALIALTQTGRREGTEEDEEISQGWAVDLFDATGRWLARHPLGPEYPMALLDWGPDGLYILNPYGDAAVHRFEVVPPR